MIKDDEDLDISDVKNIINKKTVILALGAALSLSFPVGATENTSGFQSSDMKGGYAIDQENSKSSDGKCGEGSCGSHHKEYTAETDKSSEAKCGESSCGSKIQ